MNDDQHGDGEAVSEHPDHVDHDSPGSAPRIVADPEPFEESSGHDAVDEVLRTMTGLQERPVEEHVAVFEAAHERLRAALAEANERPGR